MDGTEQGEPRAVDGVRTGDQPRAMTERSLAWP